MKRKAFLVSISALMLILFLLAACGPSQSQLNAQSTKIAAEIFATQTAEAPSPIPTPTLTPTKTPVLSPTPVCADPLGCATFSPNESIEIGVALALSGEAGNLGRDEERGINLAIKDFGLLKGHRVELVIHDSKCSSDGGESAAQQFSADPAIVGVIGTTCSVAAIPAAEILSANGLVMISPSNTAPSLTSPDLHQSGYLRVSPNDEWQGEFAAEFAYNVLGARTMATIHDGSSYAETLQMAACDTFKKLGGTCVAQEFSSATMDVHQLLDAISEYEPDILFVPLFWEAGVRDVIIQAIKSPALQKTNLISTDATLIQETQGTVEGEYITGFIIPVPEEYRLRYEREYGESPTLFFSTAYDATQLLLNAVEAVAIEDQGTLYIPRQALRDFLYSTHDFPALSGALNCTSNGDCADRGVLTIYQVQGGEFVPVYGAGATAEEIQWQRALGANTIKEYQQYLRQYPEGRHVTEAQQRIAELQTDPEPFESAVQQGTIGALRQFLEDYPGHQKEDVVQAMLDEMTTGRDIISLLTEEKVEIETEGNGLESVILRIRRRVSYPINVIIPIGTLFVANNSAVQNMVTTSKVIVRLTTTEWKEVSLPTACANMNLEAPGSGDTFTLRSSPYQDELAAILPFLEEERVSYPIRQAAIWIITDNASYDDLGILVVCPSFMLFCDTRAINEEEAARAMQIIDEAGIDITQKRIWQDRYEILQGLPEGTLKEWLENR